MTAGLCRPTPCRPFRAPRPSISSNTAGFGGEALPVFHRIHEPRSGHHLEAFVDADEEFRRDVHRLDGAELRAFDLPGIEPNWLAG